MTKSNQTEQPKPASIRVRLMDAIKKKRKPMTLTQLYTAVPDKSKAAVRGVLNSNVGKHFDRVSEGTYDLIRAPKGGEKVAAKPTEAKKATSAKAPEKASAKPAGKTAKKPAPKKAAAAASKAKPTTAKTTGSKATKPTAGNKATTTAKNATTDKK